MTRKSDPRREKYHCPNCGCRDWEEWRSYVQWTTYPPKSTPIDMVILQCIPCGILQSVRADNAEEWLS